MCDDRRRKEKIAGGTGGKLFSLLLITWWLKGHVCALAPAGFYRWDFSLVNIWKLFLFIERCNFDVIRSICVHNTHCDWLVDDASTSVYWIQKTFDTFSHIQPVDTSVTQFVERKISTRRKKEGRKEQPTIHASTAFPCYSSSWSYFIVRSVAYQTHNSF